ncbi:LuxR family transcriptional regulator [Streptomyces sp. UNOB3_S3]|uniref:helix-turn-helix transcriptional regulator n=1 Tax=Streptomyces sp. UNOB3_S3 TaxID=2871682 RepID=UPI001E533AE9|nr:LuxR family transcriptional regulator [Streptomyces sp. UNOB3_S3]MCC3776134.1 LuxR family transcriptional regulator [Streptomyces sp. UNOB3_S3]
MLLGRDEVLAEAAEAGESARSGNGRWLLFGAATGMGRTALLEEVVRQVAADGGMRVLVARCSPEESTFPFALVRQIFSEAEVGTGTGPGPGFGLGAEDIPFTDPPAAEEQQTFHRLVASLARTAGRRPVLLAVDDLHDADTVSRRWIGYLARRLAGLPVLLVLTECLENGATALPRATGTSVTLRALAPSAVTRLALAGPARTGQQDADRAELCVQACAGNPALVHALLADLREGPLPGRLSDLAGHRYRDVIGHWLRARATPRSRRVSLALAVAGDGLTALGGRLLHEAAGLGPDSPATPPDTSGLRRLFSHPLAREAALAAAEPAELDALRRRVARLLDEQGAPAAQVAAHLLHIDRPGEEWMTQSLEDAAEDAVRDGRTDEATALLRHALTAHLAPGRRAGLTLRLAALELPHSADAGIRRLRAAMELHAEGDERAAVAPALGAALVARGRTDTAMHVMHQVGSAIEDDELVRAFQTTAALMASHDAIAWRNAVARMRELAATAPAVIEPLACGLVTEYEVGAGELSAAEAMTRVLPRLKAPVVPRLRTGWLGSAATLLQWADRLDEARALADECLPAPPVLPDLTDIGRQCLISVRAEAALWAGDFRRVIAENTPLLDACTGQGLHMPHLVSMVALAHFELGHRAHARRLVAALDEVSADSSWEWNELRYARASMHLAEGSWQAALDDYLSCGRGQSARDFVSPVATPWRSGAALALVRLGQPMRALDLAEEELRHARTWGTPRTVGRALRAHAVAMGGRRGLDSLHEAVAVLRQAPAPVELIETLLDLGHARIGAGNGRKGREDLHEAHTMALRLLAPDPAPDSASDSDSAGGRQPADAAVSAPVTGRLVRATENALRTGGARRTNRGATGSAALTDAERRIVELAAMGRTNAEIGAALHLARRTVETHLTNAYRKLGVTRRTQLASCLDGAGAGTPSVARDITALA